MAPRSLAQYETNLGFVMLEELSVKNLGILGQASIDIPSGFVVVTGETGAGKTLLLGALRLLAGENASRSGVGPQGDELSVTGRFLIDGVDVVVQRKVTTKGKSRAYLDGEIAAAGDLRRKIGERVEVVAQHDGFRLGSPTGARTFLDDALDPVQRSTLGTYAQKYATWRGLISTRAAIGEDLRSLEREHEMVAFQAQEIAAAGFSIGDDADLQIRVERLRNREEISELLNGIDIALNADQGAVSALADAGSLVRRLVKLDVSVAGMMRQVADIEESLAVLAGEIARHSADDVGDGDMLESVEMRIALLSNLRRKYGDSLEDVLAFGKQASMRRDELGEFIERSGTLDDEIEGALSDVGAAAADLTNVRIARAQQLAEATVGHLTALGFTDPSVAFTITSLPPAAHGADRVVLEFASHSSLTPSPIQKVASGGELSRLVLALRLAAGIESAAVVAFDEIDAGIGGLTARAMGSRLQELASGRQVFCVTHLPQVAAYADGHIFVERDGTVATARVLSPQERVDEIARMLSGMPESESGIRHAEELLASSVRSGVAQESAMLRSS